MRIDVYVHLASADVETRLAQLTEKVNHMATKDEVIAAIAAERKQVADAMAKDKADAQAQIDALKAQLTAGSPVTAADLDEIKAAVEGIYTQAIPPVNPI